MANYYVTTSGSDSNAGTSEGAAFASPGKAASVATTSGDVIYVKAGTYTLTSSSSNVSGGRVTLTVGVRMEGYAVTPGDRAALPVINAGAITGIDIITLNSSFNTRSSGLFFIEVDGNSGTGNRGIYSPQNYVVNIYGCIARNCNNYGFHGNVQHICVNCSAIGCNIGFYSYYTTIGCVAKSCTSNGFEVVKTLYFCRASGNGGHGFNFYNQFACSAKSCISHGNTLAGFSGSYDIAGLIDCISTNNGTYGADLGPANNGLTCINFAHRSNGSGAFAGTPFNAVNTIALSSDPYVNAASDNFALNTTAGGGALLRAKGLPASIPGDGTTGYPDIGMYQHQDSAGGSVALPVVRGVL